MCDKTNLKKLIKDYRNAVDGLEESESPVEDEGTIRGMEHAWLILHPEQPSLHVLAFTGAKLKG